MSDAPVFKQLRKWEYSTIAIVTAPHVAFFACILLIFFEAHPIWVIVTFASSVVILLGHTAAITPWLDLWNELKSSPFATLLRWAAFAGLIISLGFVAAPGGLLDRLFGPLWFWAGFAIVVAFYLGAAIDRLLMPSRSKALKNVSQVDDREGCASVSLPKLRYWIQLADYSHKDYAAVDLEGAERVLRNNDWRTALAFMRALARSKGEERLEHCPPGVGFVRNDGRVLHICPNDDSTALCTYILTEDFGDAHREGLETLDRSQRLWHGSRDLSLLHQFRALQLFFRGDFDGLIRILNDDIR